MADQTGLRKIIQVEDTKYAAAVSESLGSRLAQSVNHILFYQYDHKGWVMNGKYSGGGGAQSGVDGALPIFVDMDIVGFFMFNYVAGTSGVSEIDIKRHSASGVGTTIFSVRPSMSYTAGNQAYMMNWLSPAAVLENPSGTTLPTFSVTSLDKGDALTLDWVSRQLGAESCTVTLAVRPR